MEAFDQEGAARRGLLGRLEHHRIARDQRRDDVAVGQMRGEIIGAEHGQHAMRLVAHRDLVAERGFELPLRGALGISVDRNLDLVDDRSDFGPRFPIRLAGFARDEVGEILLAGANLIGEAAQRLAAVSDRMRRPFGPGGARGGDFVPGIADFARPDFRARRRFGRNQPVRHAVPPTMFGGIGQAGASARIASPIRRIAAILASNGSQSSCSVDRRPDRLDLLDMHRTGVRRSDQ